MNLILLTIMHGMRTILASLLLMLTAPVIAVDINDCKFEQDTFVKASIDNTIHPEGRKILSSAYVRKREDEVRAHLYSGDNASIPWHVADIQNIRTAKHAEMAATYHLKSIPEYEAVLATFSSRPPYAGDTRFSPESYKRDIAYARMQVCLLDVRRRELAGSDTQTSAGLPTTGAAGPIKLYEPVNCVPKSTAAANTSIENIEAKIEVFLASSKEQNAVAITRSLQVVMWASDAMSKTIQQHCPDSEGFTQRLKELKATYDSAMQACVKIQTRSEVCGPVAP